MEPQSDRGTWYPVAVALLAAAVGGWSLYRAAVLTITHDEAITQVWFVAGGPRHIYDPARYDANNHVLYSLLAWVSTGVFGVSEWALRLPAVLAGAFVVVATGRFFRLLAGPTALAFIGVLAVVLNPLVMDYLAVARGYGLGLGLSLWAWGSLIRALTSGTRGSLVSAGVSQGLAVGANLVFVFPNLAVAVVFLTLWLIRSPARSVSDGSIGRRLRSGLVQVALYYVLPGAVLAAALTVPILGHLGGDRFYYGTDSLFEMAESLVEPSLHPVAERGWFGRPDTLPVSWLRPLTGVAVALFALTLVPLARLRRRNARGNASTPSDSMIYGGTAGAVGLLVLSHVLAGTPYPQDRTGIYFVPLAVACLVLGLKRVPRLGPWGSVGLAVLAVHFAAQLQAGFFLQWRYDAGTGAVYHLLDARAAAQPGLRVGHDWRFEPALNYYNWRAPNPRFPGFDRRGPDGEYDLYYLEAETWDAWRARGTYRVVYEDPASKAVVVERGRK